jgi:hypothetical protein
MDIEFIEATHTYAVDGKFYPSVTKVLKETALWPEFYVKHDNTVRTGIFHLKNLIAELKKKAMSRSAINIAVGTYIDEQDEIIRGYLTSWDKLRRDITKQFGWSEFEMHVASHELEVAGTLDVTGAGRFTGRVMSFLGDYKCGEAYEEYGYQTAGYHILKYGEGVHGILRFGIHLKKDGSLPYIAHHQEKTDFAIFKEACRMFHQQQNKDL